MRTGCMRGLLISACLSASLAGHAAESGEEVPKTLEFSGFGTLGMVQASRNSAEFVRDQSQRRGVDRDASPNVDSRLGVQLDWHASDALDFVVQGVERHGAHDDTRGEVSWAFVKYNASPNLSVRAGRVGAEFYMLADSRHVGYSYLTVRPPVEIFGMLSFYGLDGGDVTGTVPLAGGVLKGKAFYGRAYEEVPYGDALFSLRGNRLAGGYLDYQRDVWQWRLTYARIAYRHDLPEPMVSLRNALLGVGTPQALAAASDMTFAGTVSRFYSLGFVRDDGPLQIQGMARQVEHSNRMYEGSRAAYLLGGYRIGEMTPFAGYSRTWSQPKSRIVSGVAPIDALLSSSYFTWGRLDQKTWSLGARWDFRKDMALKGQVDFIRGRPDSRFLYPVSTSAYDGRLDVYSLALDFVF